MFQTAVPNADALLILQLKYSKLRQSEEDQDVGVRLFEAYC